MELTEYLTAWETKAKQIACVASAAASQSEALANEIKAYNDGLEPPDPPDPPQRPAEPSISYTYGPPGSGKLYFLWTQPATGGPTKQWRAGTVGDGIPNTVYTSIPTEPIELSDQPMGVPLNLYVMAENDGLRATSAVRVTCPPMGPGPQPPDSFDEIRNYAETVGCLDTSGFDNVDGRMDVGTGDNVDGVVLDGYLNFTGRPKSIRNMVINNTAAWATMYAWDYGCDDFENITIIGGADACLQMSNTRLRNIRMIASKGCDAFKFKSGFDMEHFYAELLPATPPAEHVDGGQCFDGRDMRIADGLVAGRSQITSALMVASDPGKLTNVLIEWVLVTMPDNEMGNIPYYFWKSSDGSNGDNVVGRDLGADVGGGWNSGPAYNTINADLERVAYTS